MAKTYYWLKLHNDFFSSKRIKKLRKLGSDFVIIYLKMQLLSLSDNGVIEFSGIEDDFASEIALDIDEDAAQVQLTIAYLQSCGLLEFGKDTFILPYVEKITGSECDSAERVRKHRKSQKMLHCNADVTKCNTEIDIEIDKDIDINNNGDFNKKNDKQFCENNKQETCEQFFERIWKLYPKKLGKGQISYQKKVKLQNIGYEQMKRCIDRYIDKCNRENTDNKFVMYGSTFFNSGYVDYLDENFIDNVEQEEKKEMSAKEAALEELARQERLYGKTEQ